tara:strand:- start:694 stop:1356 length:663 start_codon:yes stop_codon:yes gene_type:complete
MTAREEDILTSTNLIEKGIVIDKLLSSVIANPKVKLDDLFVGDKNALMLGTRVLGYGPEYPVTIPDPDTGLEVEHSFDLTKLDVTYIDEKLFKNGNNVEFELPTTKRKITFKLLTHRDEQAIEQELKQLEKYEEMTGVKSELTTRWKHQITSIDGDTSVETITNFVDNQFLARDARALRNYIAKIQPNIIFEQEYTSQIGEPHKVEIPIGVRFFWPDSIL